MSDFWAKKLGGQQPRGIVVPSQPVYPQPPPMHPQPQPHVAPQQPMQVDYSQMTVQQQAMYEAELRARQAAVDPNPIIHNLAEFRATMGRWRGGDAWKKEGDLRCPRCNSIHYTEGANAQGHVTQTGVLAKPRPRCFSCGYTPDYIQGDAANWA